MMIYVCQSMYVYVYDFQGSPKFFMAASPQLQLCCLHNVDCLEGCGFQSCTAHVFFACVEGHAWHRVTAAAQFLQEP